VGYESLIRRLRRLRIGAVAGDFVEIGAFLGGGSRKLAAYAAGLCPPRTLHVADVFDPDFDWTTTTAGRSMAQVYSRFLDQFGGCSQLEVFKRVVAGMENINVIIGDSKNLSLPCAAVAFAFVDGNHDPEYVTNDFYKVWSLVPSGGVVAFHDYGGNLPQTTAAIEHLRDTHRSELREFIVEPKKTLAYLIKQ
jgi:hypothetical protein